MAIDRVRRRPGGRSAQVRAAVLDATLELLAETGPATVSIAAVAQRAGVHETSVYRRWGTRDRLILDAMTNHSAELVAVPDSGALHGDLVALGMSLVRYGETPLGTALMRTLASSEDDDHTAPLRQAFWTARLEQCHTLVDRARSRGELPEDADARLLLELVIAPLHFRLLLTREPVTEELVDQLARAAVKAVS